MKIETETKFRLQNLRALLDVTSKLQKLSAVQEWEGVESVHFFDIPAYNPKPTVRMKDCCTVDGRHTIYLTVKQKAWEQEPKPYKTRLEYEVEVSSLEQTKLILTLLGCREMERDRYSKARAHWVLPDGAKVECDQLYGRYYYVEIEAPPARIKQLAGQLGLDLATSTTESYTDIVRELRAEGKKKKGGKRQ